MGRMARVQDRQEAHRKRRPRISEAHLPQADVELHLVGESQGRRGHEYLPGRISRAGQHRRVRSQRPPAYRRLSRTVRRNQLDGHVHPEFAGYRTGTGQGRTVLRRRGQQILGAFYLHCACHEPSGSQPYGTLERRRRFFYDVLKLPDGSQFPMKIRSLVGLIPLFAVETPEPEVLDRLPDFKRRLEWFIGNRPDLTENFARMRSTGMGERRLLSIANEDQLRRILSYMLDEHEFLSPYGIRALSQFHRENPYVLHVNGTEHRVDYEPGESSTGVFGGNSNWRGPIWFPVNFLLVESLQKFHHYLGDD